MASVNSCPKALETASFFENPGLSRIVPVNPSAARCVRRLRFASTHTECERVARSIRAVKITKTPGATVVRRQVSFEFSPVIVRQIRGRKTFDVMTVTKKMTKELRKKYTKNEENRLHFNKDLAEKKSKAAAGLAQWITAIE